MTAILSTVNHIFVLFTMELTWLQYLALIGVGILTGAINTLAGSGSFITLPVLIFMGMSPSLANGTNRVGVLLQSAVGAYSLQKMGGFGLKNAWWFIVPAIIGALIGAQLAVEISEKALETFIGILMVVMLIIVLLNPGKWMRQSSVESNKHSSVWMIVLFFLIGIYGGFIQAGVGIFMLAALVTLGNYSFNHSNTLKLIVTLMLTIPSLAIFAWNGQVDWIAGFSLAIGQGLGALAAAAYATRYPNSNWWMHRFLVLIIIIIIIRYFHIHTRLYDFITGI